MDETKTDTTSHQGGRIQPRRSSRSALSGSPITQNSKEDRNGTLADTATVSPSSSSSVTTSTTEVPSNNSTESTTTAAITTATANHHSRVTRSLSADSNSNEESSNSNPPSSALNGKRRRHTSNAKSNKRKAGMTPSSSSSTTTSVPISPSSSSTSSITAISHNINNNNNNNNNNDDYERETRNTTQRLSKEAKDARKAEREIIVKKKLSELETLERTVKDQSHEEYQKLLEDIQSKRSKKLHVAQGRHALMETNFRNGFLAQKKSAFDKFCLDKLALRRNMMNQVQQKINRIEQEYFYSQQGAKSSLDDNHLRDWTPPDRPSMISSLTLGLDEQEIAQDFAGLQEVIPSISTSSSSQAPSSATPNTQSIEDCHPLEQSKKQHLSLISST